MEAFVVNPEGNPRRKRRRVRHKRRRATSHRRRRRRTHLNGYANPRPRRRRGRRRAFAHRRRRRHSNPRFGLGAGLTAGLKTGLGIGLGVVVTEVGTTFALSKIPGVPAALQSGPGRLVSKAIVGGVIIPALLKMTPAKTFAKNVAIGAWVSIATDVLNAYVVPALHLSEYSSGEMGVYSSGELGDEGAPEEVGAAENMYSDTMY